MIRSKILLTTINNTGMTNEELTALNEAKAKAESLMGEYKRVKQIMDSNVPAVALNLIIDGSAFMGDELSKVACDSILLHLQNESSDASDSFAAM